MADPVPDAPSERPIEPSATTAKPVTPPEREPGRYDANIQLIRRRLADHNRTNKPKWWWPSR